MRILQVVHGFPSEKTSGTEKVGGTELLTYFLAKELSKENEVYVLYPSKVKNTTFKTRGSLNIVEVPKDNSIMSYLKITRTYKNRSIENIFSDVLAKIKPDVVHFQHLLSLSLKLPLVANKKNIPVVLTLNDYWFVCHETHFLKLKMYVCSTTSPKECYTCFTYNLLNEITIKYNLNNKLVKFTLKNILKILNKVLNRQQYLEERYKLSKKAIEISDIVTSPSKSIAKQVKENLDVNRDISIIAHGVDEKTLSSIRKENHSKLFFGFVGTPSKRKGLSVLIDAFEKVNCSNTELRIFGRVEENLQTRNIGNLKIMGRFEDITEPYSKIDVLIVPSITYEGYGLVVQESFAAGIPVIASDIPALNEFVEHGKNGLAFRPGDSYDLAKKIQMICDDDRLLSKLKEGIDKPKSLEKWSDEILELYTSLVPPK